MEFRTFTIDVPQPALDDLARRLANTRWPNEQQTTGWEAGTELEFMQRLAARWADGYDWRAVEARLNRFDHLMTSVDGVDVHLVHERATRPGAVPVVLLHGWPDSFYRYAHVVDRLTGRAGDDGGPVFDVVVPSLPGFGFSGQPAPGRLTPASAGATIARVLEGLGYDRYALHGGDWGAAVAQEIARAHPERVVGLHLTDVPFGNVFLVDQETASESERAFLAAGEAWASSAAYFTVQAYRPLQLAYALSDSPAGLAAWIVGLFREWSDAMPADDDLLTNVMIYWITNTIRSSFRFYSEGTGADWDGEEASWGDDGATASGGEDAAGAWSPRVEVPTALALFPEDIGERAPREYAERFFDVRRYTLMPRGGHFAALETPEMVASDVRAFLADLGAGD